MNVAAGPKLAAAVTNAGGLGVIGGVCFPLGHDRHSLTIYRSATHRTCSENK